MTRVTHPCLTCTLPDCDDRNARCALRRIAGQFAYLRKHKREIPEDLYARHSIARKELWGNDYNERRRARHAARQEQQHA